MVIWLAPLSALAQQSTAVLGGRVLDVANGSPIAFASVVIEDAASGKQLSGTLTGENGRFVVQGLLMFGPSFVRVFLRTSRLRLSTRPLANDSIYRVHS